jgi:hypothetical protein
MLQLNSVKLIRKCLVAGREEVSELWEANLPRNLEGDPGTGGGQVRQTTTGF